MTLSERLKQQVREVPDFPQKGVLFKDISPLFLDPSLVREAVNALVEPWRDQGITKVIGIDSRGFLLGPQIAQALEAGFVMVRKKGKLPPETISVSYELEYGKASLESVIHSLQPHDRVIIHDDLLATGGTAAAAAGLARKLGSEIAGFSFIIHLTFLQGALPLQAFAPHIHTLIQYDQ